MKAFLVMILGFGLAWALLFTPVGGRSFWTRSQERGIPAAIARGTAHALRAGWELLSSIGEHSDPVPEPSREAQATRVVPAKQPQRKVQAAAPPGHKASREGIVAQPPKEKLGDTDRAALNALVARSR